MTSGDIVLAWGSGRGEPPYLEEEATDWLIETGIKAIGLENLALSPPGVPFGPAYGDARLLAAGIGFIDAPVRLARITMPRVFVIALPVKMRRVTASWTRLIALEEKTAREG